MESFRRSFVFDDLLDKPFGFSLRKEVEGCRTVPPLVKLVSNVIGRVKLVILPRLVMNPNIPTTVLPHIRRHLLHDAISVIVQNLSMVVTPLQFATTFVARLLQHAFCKS